MVSIYKIKKNYLKILLNLFLIILIFYKNDYNNISKNKLDNFQVQTLNIILPSKKLIKCPTTLYFKSQFGNLRIEKNISKKLLIKSINFTKNQKKYFVVFHAHFVSYKEKLLKNDYHIIIYNNSNNNLNTTLNLIWFLYFPSKRLKNIYNFAVNKFTKLMFFRELKTLFNKDITYKNYDLMRRKFKDDYSYMSETFNYPKDKKIIENKFKNYKFNPKNMWMIKPKNKNSGEGIKIFTSLKEIILDNYLITKYITNIDLIDKKKYDLRIYVLILGINPLRIYLYKNGFVRRCVKDYSLDINLLNDKNIHLTNTHVNVEKKEYIHPKNFDDENAHIWSLKTYKNFLEKKKVNYDLINEKIKDIIIKTIISFYSNFNEQIKKKNFQNLNFFDLLGFDILMTDNYNPKLLEVNTNPSPYVFNYLMRVIKTNLFLDTLNLIGIIPFSHEDKYKIFNQEYNLKNNENFIYNEALCEMARPRGDYELIFPLKNNIKKYKKYFFNLDVKNINFWEKILKGINK